MLDVQNFQLIMKMVGLILIEAQYIFNVGEVPELEPKHVH